MNTLATANTTLTRNLMPLRQRQPQLVATILETEPLPLGPGGLTWIDAPDGAMAATLQEGTTVRALASKRAPLAEAETWAAQAELTKHAAFVVRGFGLGHHVAALCERVQGNGVIFVYEPDLRLLRTVLERIDLSAALARTVIILTNEEDSGAMSAATSPVEPLIAMGTQIMDHAPSLPRLGKRAEVFVKRFTAVISAVRLNVMTTFMQTEATLRNFLQNIDYYTTRGGIEPLKGAFAGRPAITVASGPSLERNVDLLRDERVRDRFVIIAAQTVLKPLLARGIKPHFVTTLDFHEISARFYEGLTEQDVEGVTLVIEPKVNPAVPVAFPGRVLCTAAPFLDHVLGDLTRPMGEVPAGGTVAHLSYYLARFFGCDPVILIGQDLGFTDGQYYPAGAAIHGVWAGELNEFKSLELLEWQRIKRHTNILRRAEDHLGRPVYTDEQMHTYLMQFNRDFKGDAARGLTVIDATEGGVKKEHAAVKSLAEAVAPYLDRMDLEPVPSVIGRCVGVEMTDASRRSALRAVSERLREVRHDTWRVGDLSRRAVSMLTEAREHHADQERVNRIITRLEKLRDEVKTIEPAWPLVQMINQMGTFKRYRADRLIAIDETQSDLDRQRRQIDRDLTNVEWLADASDALARLLDDAGSTIAGGPRVTRDPALPKKHAERADEREAAAATVAAVILLDFERNGLGVPHEPERPVWNGRTALSLTLERLGRSTRLERVVVVSDDPARAERIASPLSRPQQVEFVKCDAPARAWPTAVSRAGRLFGMHGWRGGLGDWTIYDEALDPSIAQHAIERLGMDGALVVGADWWLVDPVLIDRVIERYQESTDAHRFTFAHAGPGLGACVCDVRLLKDLAKGRAGHAGAFASLGGVAGFIPTAPIIDMIGKGMCVTASPIVRDLVVRCTADTPQRGAWLASALKAAGLDAVTADAERVAMAVSAYATHATTPPAHLTLELIDAHGTVFPTDAARAHIAAHAGGRPDTTLTLLDRGLSHPWLVGLIGHARAVGIGAVHVRTDFSGDGAHLESVYDAHPEVISVDMWGGDEMSFNVAAPKLPDGRAPEFVACREQLIRLLDRSRGKHPAGTVGVPWIVPRLTRCDATYEVIENWYDRWLLTQGWAVIDALPARRDGEGGRIAPLPLPKVARDRRALESVFINARNERVEQLP